ncbi:oligopeptide/dipeptide ABC transporter, ATP-binding, C-terminal domain protein [Ochrobactrum quorumnocens]|uniref:Oligopeptide/dipeptide ABC transporter, ATP-binding, C-terminal domain protein n=1 Tax=Ochrobactrum quorumnocens TaxID=271865 RepID=A0A248UB87_9HYPH|nr:ABC transporter ATP-binding protein [[Ochrobactrum] quorumnocens]ASV83800.1 oligopeptide/dipeptide ABC transporter, ATP-binding, C-terminal domain protein [[Ochrobactrum] quorumnocens]
MSEKALLEVENLRIDITSGSVRHNVVEDVSFTISAGETFGLVGESGCGKSITALSMIGLLRKPLSVTGGAIRFKGQDLRAMSSRDIRKLRGNRIAMIFQEPMTALNPLSPVGRQIAEMFVLHQGATWHEAEQKAVEALGSVQVPAPEQRVKNYPHQMSGGMRQRVMIAIALACNPDLLIADEPTTALDVTVQAEILRLMQELCSARGTSVLMISHDLGVIAKMCRRVGVMYAGHLVEERVTAGLFHHPAHPYAHGLLASLPKLGSRQKEGQRQLQEIEGVVPSISAFPQGCRFEPRCTRATDICRAEKPGWTPLQDAGSVRCFHHE